MVNEILRERDHAGFGDRNEYGSRMGGGGIDVSNLLMKKGEDVNFPCNKDVFIVLHIM